MTKDDLIKLRAQEQLSNEAKSRLASMTIAKQCEMFFAKGGKIKHIESGVRATDYPRHHKMIEFTHKPTSLEGMVRHCNNNGCTVRFNNFLKTVDVVQMEKTICGSTLEEAYKKATNRGWMNYPEINT